jgi:hypothetical protein
MSLEKGINERRTSDKKVETQQWFQKLIQQNEYVGELYSINYETARVIIHDSERKKVGGIPSLSFLIASRVDPANATDIDFKSEDASFILLRVMDSAPLPQDKEAERIRVETAQRVSGETEKHWDSDGAMDAKTRVLLGYAGVQCRIIGTFFLEENGNNSEAPLSLKFGSDISNYYPNRGLKVFKPNAEALQEIVNYCDPSNIDEQEKRYGESAKAARVKIGNVRYASTNRKYQQIDDVPVYVFPMDLLSQKSALFGMTRTGKSNTTKIIAKSVFELRKLKNRKGELIKIGQIIFDPNGEYANENVQDNNNALKNIWKNIPNAQKQDEVCTYGISKHPDDPDRRLMLINFYHSEMLQIGKEIINTILVNEQSQYFRNFRTVRFDKPNKEDFEKESEFFSENIRYERRVLAYRALLRKAGFNPPRNLAPRTKVGNTPFFGRELIAAMRSVQLQRNEIKKQNLIHSAAEVFTIESPSWEALENAFEGLFYFLSTDAYNVFNNAYIQGSSTGESWADADLERIIELYAYSKGTNLLGKLIPQHSENAKTDFAQDIYDDLLKGKLVIVDQSIGEPALNKDAAERIMWEIFRRNQADFRDGKIPPDILIYLEEAHNLLPASNEMDLEDIWVRTAKEAAKYRIGMVYATQEVSSVQKNILKNTANWFIAHLNNTDETKELCKYYDFADFEPSIRRAQDKGFLRVKTLSNLFVIPVQVDKFEV